jgi:hypothetical protein
MFVQTVMEEGCVTGESGSLQAVLTKLSHDSIELLSRAVLDHSFLR